MFFQILFEEISKKKEISSLFCCSQNKMKNFLKIFLKVLTDG